MFYSGYSGWHHPAFNKMRFFRSFLLLVCVVATLAVATLPVYAISSKSTPISEDEYWKLIQASRDTISQLEKSTGEETKQTLNELASQWESITEVNVHGQIVLVDNSYLISLLREKDPNLQKIDDLFSALQNAHKKQLGQVFSTKDLDPLHTILARPEFIWAEQTPSPLNTLLQKILDALNRLLNRIFGNNPISANISTTTFSIIAAIILAIVLIFVFRTLFKDFIKEAQLSSEEGEGNEPLTSEAAFDKAQTLSRGGDYRSAVRYLYLSSLLLMDERGVLRYDRSKTNREYLRSVSNSPDLAKPLGEVIEVFDNVWYGYHTVEEETFKHYRDRVEELKEKKHEAHS
ncbi:MAG: DUF4129 domain-containing protein [Anaerolineales bacterium]